MNQLPTTAISIHRASAHALRDSGVGTRGSFDHMASSSARWLLLRERCFRTTGFTSLSGLVIERRVRADITGYKVDGKSTDGLLSGGRGGAASTCIYVAATDAFETLPTAENEYRARQIFSFAIQHIESQKLIQYGRIRDNACRNMHFQK